MANKIKRRPMAMTELIKWQTSIHLDTAAAQLPAASAAIVPQPSKHSATNYFSISSHQDGTKS
jgi:hypothetical protein